MRKAKFTPGERAVPIVVPLAVPIRERIEAMAAKECRPLGRTIERLVIEALAARDARLDAVIT